MRAALRSSKTTLLPALFTLALTGCGGSDAEASSGLPDAGSDAGHEVPEPRPDSTPADTGSVVDSAVPGDGGTKTGTKWFPGVYQEVVSPGLKAGKTLWDEGRSLEFLELPNARGYMLVVEWAELEKAKGDYDVSLVKTVLDFVHSKKKKLILVVMDRSFAGDTSAHLPAYLSGAMDCKYVTADKKRGTFKWYKPACVDRFLALYKVLGTAFDAHPALAGVTAGYPESALKEASDQPDFTSSTTLAAQQLRSATESKDYFPTTLVALGFNWLPDPKGWATALEARRGTAFVHPDPFPGDYVGQDWDKDGKGDSTQTEIAYAGRVPTFAKNEQTFITGDLADAERKQWNWQLNQIKASFFIWGNGASYTDDYVGDRVLPFMKTSPVFPMENTKCPTAVAPCITD